MRVKSTKKTRARKGKDKAKADAQSKELKFVIHDIEFTPSPVLDTMFRFMAERHAIHQRRVAGLPEPWSDDPIFQNNPFTNVYRIFDRVSQYILQHVVNEGDQDLHESCFRVILFRFFCRISTWEHLQKRLGPLTWKDFDIEAYEDVLGEQYHKGVSLYGSAYQMPAPALGGATAYSNHLRLLKMMMDADLPGQLAQLEQLSDAYGRINLFPSMGNFLAFQYALLPLPRAFRSQTPADYFWISI
ncbi:hypothetical protein EWM64_g9452 [Hericium alpestre]|uniref:5-hmdU DNA kinase helical domain-containing protein n=1 Tax=Hericium alpestre TaxID=135208 RepID=A0A4Y9ZK49_9AGAM|nr:hypothetical protein EWM64_g9452 [Hericium alpestre]